MEIERVVVDASAIRERLAADILMSLAARRVVDLRWPEAPEHAASQTLVTQEPVASEVIRVERLAPFLSRKLEEEPRRVLAGLRSMAGPWSTSQLIDAMARSEALHAFAREVNGRVRPDERGTVFANTAALDAVQFRCWTVGRSRVGSRGLGR
jgi:hypothetical protein